MPHPVVSILCRQFVGVRVHDSPRHVANIQPVVTTGEVGGLLAILLMYCRHYLSELGGALVVLVNFHAAGGEQFADVFLDFGTA